MIFVRLMVLLLVIVYITSIYSYTIAISINISITNLFRVIPSPMTKIKIAKFDSNH